MSSDSRHSSHDPSTPPPQGGPAGPAWEAGSMTPHSTGSPGPAPGSAGSLPSIEDYLLALGQLPGMVAFRLLTPAQSNAMQSAYRTILQNHPEKQQSPELNAVFEEQDLLMLARESPQVLNMLAPILTANQIDYVLQTEPEPEHPTNDDEPADAAPENRSADAVSPEEPAAEDTPCESTQDPDPQE